MFEWLLPLFATVPFAVMGLVILGVSIADHVDEHGAHGIVRIGGVLAALGITAATFVMFSY